MKEGTSPDKPCPVTHPGVSIEELLAQSNYEEEHIIQIQNLHHEYPHLFLDIANAVQENKYRSVLIAVEKEEPATYEDILPLSSCGKRTIRRALNDLSEKDIVDVTRDRFTFVTFASDASRILTKDVLNMFFDTIDQKG